MTAAIRVLHVDDELDFADITATYLESADTPFEVETTTSIEAAMDHLRADAIDCVVADYDMPAMTGLEFLDLVRSEFDDLPFVLFTGKGSEEVASEAITAGVTDYIQKGAGPDRFDILANRIVNAVERTRADRAANRMRARFESLSAAFPDLAFYIDERGTYLDVIAGTDSDLLADDADRLLDRRFHEVLPEPTADRFLQVVTDAIETGDVQSIEYQLDVLAGSRWFDGRIAPIDDPVGDRPAVIWVARDVTDRKRREVELNELRHRYETILSHSSDFVIILDETATITYHSPSIERVLGYASDELLGEPVTDYIHEDDLADAATAFSETLTQSDGEISIELRLRTKDETFQWAEVRGRNFLDEPLIEGILVNVRDISDRRVPERALRETKRRLDLALEGSDTGIWELNLETDELYWSDDLLRLLGLGQEEFSGRLDFFEDRLHPDDREVVSETIAEAIDSGEMYHVEQRLLHEDGYYVWLEVRGQTVSDEDGDYLIGVSIDITERKRREEELEHHRTIVQAAGDGMYVLDTDGCFTFVNDRLASLLNYEPDALLGESAKTVLDDRDYEAGTDLIRHLLTSEADQGTYEMSLHLPDGTNLPCENHITLLTENGTYYGTAGVIRDISERKRRERELRRQNERLEEFASVVSHDLRNPLNVAQGRLELAVEEDENEHLEHVDEALDRMASLIEDLLTLARHGEQVSELEPVSLDELVTTCWANVDTRSASVEIDDPGTIYADRSRLSQLFENLIRNAVEHGGEDVTIAVGRLPGGFYLEDDGDGIPEDQRATVLEAGFSTKVDGTGFGLSIVKQVADAHGWETAVTEGRDGGARFEFRDVSME